MNLGYLARSTARGAAILLLLLCAYASAEAVTYDWHTFYGSNQWYDFGQSVAVDGSGNVYVTGVSRRAWNGPAPANTAPKNAYAGGEDIFVLKLDSSGNYLWHTFFGSAGNDDSATAIAVDGSGNVYVAGQSYTTWNGPELQAPLNPHDSSPGSNSDMVILKLDTDGNYLWHTFHGSYGDDFAAGIAVSGSSVYVTGQSAFSWNGPAPANTAPKNAFAGSADITVLKLDTNGTYQWHTFYGSASAVDYGYAVAADGSGAVVAGFSYGSWNGPAPANTSPLHAYNSGRDIAVLKLDTSGNYLWHTFYGSSNTDTARGIALDGSGNVYVTGESAALWYGPGVGTGVPINSHSGGSGDIFALKLDASGGYLWHTFHGAFQSYGYGIAVDGSGNAFIAGSDNSSWTGPSGQPPAHAFSGNYPATEIVALKLDTNGYYQWHTFYGGGGDDTGAGIALRNADIHIAGYGGASWQGDGNANPLHAFSVPATTEINVLKLTDAPVPPTVTTAAVSGITSAGASSGGTILSNGGAAVTAKGVCVGRFFNPTTNCTNDGTGVASYASVLAGLQPGQTYHVRAYATNSAGTGYGADVQFVTQGDLYVASWFNGKVVRYNGATGALVGDFAVIASPSAPFGITFGPDGNFYVTDYMNHKVVRVNGTTGAPMGDFVTTNLNGPTGLIFGPDGNLYVASQYDNKVTRHNGTTGAYIDDIVPSGSGGLQAPFSLTFGPDGNLYVVSGGNDKVVRYDGATGALMGDFVSAGSGGLNGAYDLAFGPDGYLYVVSYGINEIKQYNGTTGAYVTSFITLNLNGPTGLVFGSNNHFYITNGSSNNVEDYNAAGGFVGVFGQTGGGAIDHPKFLTFGPAPAAAVPSLSTAAVTNITGTAATSGGFISSDGGASITERGVCRSTNPNPTTADTCTQDGTGTGAFTSSLTSLSPGQTYYVRAYATNGAGTGYGNELQFAATAGAAVPPSVTTAAVTNIAATTATSGGTITADGGASVSERGVCWSLAANPTIADTCTSDGTGTGTFTSSIAGLTAGQTYHVRAYARNTAGYGYGGDLQFTAVATVSAPTVSATTSITNIAATTANSGGSVASDGGASVMHRGVCWSASVNPTINDTCTDDGTGTGSFVSSITGLTPGQTYHVRAYATNSAGTAYGNDIQFTTAAAATGEATAVPTMNEWGMIGFVVLAGLGAAYYLRRQRIV